MSHRFIAHAGLTATFLTLALAIGVLARQAAVAATPPTVEVGKTAPTLTLPDTAGQPVSLADFHGQSAIVLFFGSDACTLSHRYADRLASLAATYPPDARVHFFAINTNTQARATAISALKLTDSDRIPTLIDPCATAARAFGVTVTPTFCVIDSAGTLRYAGSFDNGQPDPAKPDQYLARALERTVDGIPCEIPSTQAFGRSIAWVK